ncbi:hypothetical protein CTA1_8711 [Colletotrichum tanaceti]|uniref:Uncharacterized protein n=1 Tax=Colletotrichum tanaceti TaxID=1306861 RepID=A0A4U6XNL0_9PEZI|nr:hypothetical protein CTA1_8711 [Colletotrichum tanaceti]
MAGRESNLLKKGTREDDPAFLEISARWWDRQEERELYACGDGSGNGLYSLLSTPQSCHDGTNGQRISDASDRRRVQTAEHDRPAFFFPTDTGRTIRGGKGRDMPDDGR